MLRRPAKILRAPSTCVARSRGQLASGPLASQVTPRLLTGLDAPARSSGSCHGTKPLTR